MNDEQLADALAALLGDPEPERRATTFKHFSPAGEIDLRPRSVIDRERIARGLLPLGERKPLRRSQGDPAEAW